MPIPLQRRGKPQSSQQSGLPSWTQLFSTTRDEQKKSAETHTDVVSDSDSSKSQTPSRHVKRFWTPPWLRSSVLSATALLFVLLGASLLFLLFFSRSTHGLRLSTTSHYTWTYGPTAVFLLLTAVWRQIDFHCKLLTPWQVLQKKQAPVAQNILLDYISPMQVVAFGKALANKNFSVILSIAGFMIVKLLTLSSTALFVLRPSHLPISNVTTSATLFGSNINSSDPVPAGLFEPAIVYSAYAVSAKGLPYPDGMTSELLHQTINPASFSSSGNATVSAVVQALVPSYQCETAPFQVGSIPINTTDLNPTISIKLGFPECTLRDQGQGQSIYALNPHISVTPSRQLSPLVQQIDCFANASNDTDNWQLLTLVDMRYNQSLPQSTEHLPVGSNVQASSESIAAVAGTGVACRSVHNLQDVRLTYEVVGGAIHGSPRIDKLPTQGNRTLSNFTNGGLGTLVASALSAAPDMFGRLIDNQFAEEYPNTMFELMASISGGAYEALLNETVMQQAAETMFNQIALQAMDKHLRSGSTNFVQLSIARSEERLSLNVIIASAMAAGSFIVAGLALALVLFGPRQVVQQNPESLPNLACVLTRSEELQGLLVEGQDRGHNLESFLEEDFTYSSAIHDTDNDKATVIHAHKVGVTKPENHGSTSDYEASSLEHKWYRSLASKTWFLAIMLVLPLAFVGSLEAIQRVSDRKHGFVTVSDPSSQIIQLLPNVLSALAMFSIATMFNSLEFDISLLAPFVAMKHRVSVDVDGLMTTFLGRTPPMVLLVAFLKHHWPVLLSSSVALTGSLLTLVISGLYTFDTQSSTSISNVVQVDHFTPVWSQSALNDSAAAVIDSLTESTGLTFPAFTYNELAFPQIQSTPFLSNSSSISLLQVQLPAVRSDLQCSILEASAFNFTASFNTFIESASASYEARVPLSSACQRGGPSGNESFIEFDVSFSMRSNTSYISKLVDLHVGPFDGVLAESSDELEPTIQPDNPPSCPTLAFIYGYADALNPTQSTTTTFICYQHLSQLLTNTTFTLHNTSISTLHPPTPLESTTTPLSNAQNLTTFPFRIQRHFDSTFISNLHFANPTHPCSFLSPTSNTPTSSLLGSSPPIDPFFQGVLCSQPLLDITTLRSTSFSSQQTVFNATNAFYRRYMAQAISSNMRVPLTDATRSTVAALPQATILNAGTVTRLVQNNTPKIVLQVMLGVMSVLGGVAVWMGRVWEPVVPYNPCTIAGTMALFAGSEMCDRGGETGRELFAVGVEGWSREELRERWRGWEFKLGWWDRRGGGSRWGIEARRCGKYTETAGVDARNGEGWGKGSVNISWPLERGWYDVMNIVESRRTSASNYDSRRTSVTEIVEGTPNASPIEMDYPRR